MPHTRVFLLSPARCDGARTRLLLNPAADFPLARRLRESEEGAPIGEVFAFLSGLYFRGKLAYATAFADPPRGAPPSLVMTTDRGLVTPDTPVRLEDLEAFACVNLAEADERFRTPLRADAAALSQRIEPDTQVVLLGSIATGKYVDALLEHFGERLVFPREFVGRGDMSRGGLLLRHVRAGAELEYAAVAGAVRRGRRPPRLEPIR